MAAIKRGKKADIPRRSQPSKSQKTPAKQGRLPAQPKRNVCIIRFPRSSHLTTCPLVSWYFSRCMRDDLLSLHKGKRNLSPCVGKFPPKLSLRQDRKQRHSGRKCPDFLRVALRELASKKRAKGAVASAQKRRRYSDDEIFYRLAKPFGLEDAEVGASTSNAGSEVIHPHALGIPQPIAGELQEALS